MTTPHLDVRTSARGARDRAAGPTIDVAAGAWELARSKRSRVGVLEDRLALRWFMPFIQDPPGAFAPSVA